MMEPGLACLHLFRGLCLRRGLCLFRDLYPCRDLCPGLTHPDLLEVLAVLLARPLGWWSTHRSAAAATTCL